MKEFESLGEFSLYLDEVIRKYQFHKKAILVAMTALIENDAKRKFGVYQGAVGPFQGWEQLAQSTQDQRSRLGYDPNSPLFRTGELLMDSIHSKVVGDEGFVGSNEEVMVYQERGTEELGTVRIPARPVLGPAAFENKRAIAAIAKKGIDAWLANKAPIKPR